MNQTDALVRQTQEIGEAFTKAKDALIIAFHVAPQIIQDYLDNINELKEATDEPYAVWYITEMDILRIFNPFFQASDEHVVRYAHDCKHSICQLTLLFVNFLREYPDVKLKIEINGTSQARFLLDFPDGYVITQEA